MVRIKGNFIAVIHNIFDIANNVHCGFWFSQRKVAIE